MNNFFNEARARELGEQRNLLVGIPKISAKRREGRLSLEVTLPHPDAEAYTTREGRAQLENVPESLLSRVADLKEGECMEAEGTPVRGMAGGLVYTTPGAFILQSKVYPKTEDRYFAAFTGVSSSLRDIQDPRGIIAREGLEEMTAVDKGRGRIMVPNLLSSPYFLGVHSRQEIEAIVKGTIGGLKKLLTEQGIKADFCDYPIEMMPMVAEGERDYLTVREHSGRILSHGACILDVNPNSNSFDLLKVCKLNLPSGAHIYESEWGNDVAMVPFEQLEEMWNNWGKPMEVNVHLASGEKTRGIYPALFDSIVQKVAMHLGAIKEEPFRMDYKDFKKSI